MQAAVPALCPRSRALCVRAMAAKDDFSEATKVRGWLGPCRQVSGRAASACYRSRQTRQFCERHAPRHRWWAWVGG